MQVDWDNAFYALIEDDSSDEIEDFMHEALELAQIMMSRYRPAAQARAPPPTPTCSEFTAVCRCL